MASATTGLDATTGFGATDLAATGLAATGFAAAGAFAGAATLAGLALAGAGFTAAAFVTTGFAAVVFVATFAVALAAADLAAVLAVFGAVFAIMLFTVFEPALAGVREVLTSAALALAPCALDTFADVFEAPRLAAAALLGV